MLLPLLLTLSVLPGIPGGDDDLVTASIEAVLHQPLDEDIFALPIGAPIEFLFAAPSTRTAWDVVDVGDVTGDGASDPAFGYTTHGALPTLEVLDSRSGAVVWSVVAGDGGRGLRSLRCLDAAEGRLAAGVTDMGGSVEVRDASDGTLAWSVDLQPGVSVAVHAVRMVEPVTDGAPPAVLVSAGAGADRVALLDGSDGSLVWMHPAGDVTYDAVPLADFDNDGRREVLAVGGDQSPFARLLDGADGSVLWSIALPGPGTTVQPVADIDGDLIPDAVIGLFSAPESSLIAVSGVDGDQLWSAFGVEDAVTSLTLLGDNDGDGIDDLAVGSFDNAINGVLTRQGILEWRREGSTVNGGHMFSVSNIGDIDGDGFVDMVAASVDFQIYVLGGNLGQYMAVSNGRGRYVATAGLNDGDGDGRREFALGGQGRARVGSGASGLALGPIISVVNIPGEAVVNIFAYPTTSLFAFASPGTGSLDLPIIQGTFGLDLGSLVQIVQGTAPGAGISGVALGPFPPTAAGIEIFVQAVSFYSSGLGIVSNVDSFTVIPLEGED